MDVIVVMSSFMIVFFFIIIMAAVRGDQTQHRAAVPVRPQRYRTAVTYSRTEVRYRRPR